MGKRKRLAGYVGLAVVAVLAVAGCSGKDNENAELVALRKKLAGELLDNHLYQAAIEEYARVLDQGSVDLKTRAGINYLIANVYFENLKDYEQAAAYYVRARALDPQGTFNTEASKNLVASLEKMGRLVDARRQLDAATDIDYKQPEKGDVVVARIGNEPITLSQINQEMQSLPAELQKQFATREMKLRFLQNYVGTELMYRAALREKYGDDPEVKKQQEELLKKLIVNKYVVDRVIPKIKIDTMDVRNFYLAHAEERYKKAPYDSVKAQVFLDYQNEKAEAAFSDYISELAKGENVQMFEENVK